VDNIKFGMSPQVFSVALEEIYRESNFLTYEKIKEFKEKGWGTDEMSRDARNILFKVLSRDFANVF